MTVSAHDVARELRSQLPMSGVVKIHKLLYLCQGWHLAWYGIPLFVEDIEAFENGPVVEDLWRDERDRKAPPTPEQIDSNGLLVIDYVIDRYGNLSGRDLIELTHSEGPWVHAWQRPYTERTITQSELRAFFLGAEEEDAAETEWTMPPDALIDLEHSFEKRLVSSGHDETDDIRRWAAAFAS